MVKGRRLRHRQVPRSAGCYHGKYPLNIPVLDENVNVEEMMRLIMRKIPCDPDYPDFDSDDVCLVCNGKDHWLSKCPYLLSVSEDVVLNSDYDKVCLECGTIGLDCHGKGLYAVQKWCSFCMSCGHWYWEEKCEESFRLSPDRHLLWSSVKDGCPLPSHPFQAPTFGEIKDTAEIWRLMKREISQRSVDDGCCNVCYEKGHLDHQCPFLRSLPEGKAVGPEFDEACVGCGRIGVRCCSKGAYAVLKLCDFCDASGHWFWEEKCTDYCPKWVEFKNSLTMKGPSIEDSPLQACSSLGYSEDHLLLKPVKDGHSLPRPPPVIPIYGKRTQRKEVKRLLRRRIPCEIVKDDCCGVCFDKGHLDYECPCLITLPEGKILGPGFDEVCLGCGKIGMRCCSKGAYAARKWCSFCKVDGHWFWEKKCIDYSAESAKKLARVRPRIHRSRRQHFSHMMDALSIYEDKI